MVKGMKFASKFLLKLLVGILLIQKHESRKMVPCTAAKVEGQQERVKTERKASLSLMNS